MTDPHDEIEDERHAFAEELGRFFEERGLPRMEGRVVGWLVVCHPAEQSAQQLADALSASRGAISMAIRLLQRADAVERVAVPGVRRHYYRLRPNMWRQELDKRVEEAEQVRDLAAKGLERLGSAPGEQLDRLHDLHDMYGFLSTEYRRARERWRLREKERSE